MSYEDVPEHVRLAVEIIRQVENLNFAEDVVAEAMVLILQDAVAKMPEEHRIRWKNRLSRIFHYSNMSDMQKK